MKNTKAELNDTELDIVTGGTAPELPASTLEPGGYNGMFSNLHGSGQYEIHFYDGKVVDPSYFINKTEENKNE